MAIRNARRWVGAQILEAAHMNDSVSRILEERAGRHGVVELEDSLSILNGDDGDRFLQLPAGTTAQRPASPQPGYLRFNTTTSEAEYWDGTAWKHFGQSLADVLTYNILNGNGVVAVAIPDSGSTVARGAHTHPVVVRGRVRVTWSGFRGNATVRVALTSISANLHGDGITRVRVITSSVTTLGGGRVSFTANDTRLKSMSAGQSATWTSHWRNPYNDARGNVTGISSSVVIQIAAGKTYSERFSFDVSNFPTSPDIAFSATIN